MTLENLSPRQVFNTVTPETQTPLFFRYLNVVIPWDFVIFDLNNLEFP